MTEMDTIFIRDLALQATIGTLPEERTRKQPIVLNVSFSGDFSLAGKKDDLSFAVNYREVETLLIRRVENSSFFLLEALAEDLAQKILAFHRVQLVTVRIDKKGGALKADGIGLSITRRKKKISSGRLSKR
ncbi:MAG: dihydroneopterin aldolase [Lentisphaeria bacterium]|nr:dihydroneopterin aldolase [Lentisphaeria bacterium]